ncbi:MAG: glycosyltransferase [Bacteroides sp.]|nr:glycosyltransferase [Bacteroides sp.]
MEFFTLTQTDHILLAILGTLFLIQCIYYFSLYNRINLYHKGLQKNRIPYTDSLPPVSVIICAKNESHNLHENLPSILEQDYPEFEVIVINDGSTDESEELLCQLEERYPHLYHSFTPDSARYISRKKLALTLGIKASKYEWVVFTEANCCAPSKEWLRNIARNFTYGTEIVLGYSGYEQQKSWLNKKSSFDALMQGLRYLSMALAGKTYMGIGRNMAYKKELFFRNKGYSRHLNLQRGDDDLFINQVATASNTRVEAAPESVIKIRPVEYYKEWKEEKVSYTATSQYYKGPARYIWGFETFSRILYYFSFFALTGMAIYTRNWFLLIIGISLFMIRYLCQLVIINKSARNLGEERRYYTTLPLFDLYFPFNTLKFKIYRFFRGKGDFMRR